MDEINAGYERLAELQVFPSDAILLAVVDLDSRALVFHFIDVLNKSVDKKKSVSAKSNLSHLMQMKKHLVGHCIRFGVSEAYWFKIDTEMLMAEGCYPTAL